MASIFKKLNLKEDDEIIIINAPARFEIEIDKLEDVSVVRDLAEASEICFSLVFVTQQHTLNSVAAAVADKGKGDAIDWIAYPKKSPKRYTCELTVIPVGMCWVRPGL